MKPQKLQQLEAMIQKADFLEEATKQLFLNKIPVLPENKLEDLFEIFAKNEREHEKVNQERLTLFEKYKLTLMGIYQQAKKTVIALKERAVAKVDQRELKILDEELGEM